MQISCHLRVSVSLCLCVKRRWLCTVALYRLLPIVVATALLTGCGGSRDTVRVSGQLMKDGKPYGAKLSGKEPETFAVDFVGTIKERPYRFGATTNEDGSFRVVGSDERGIPRGQYKI